MTRSHRSAHRILWIVLTLAVGLGLVAALMLRAPAQAASPVVIGDACR
jgi:hypothetical protein